MNAKANCKGDLDLIQQLINGIFLVCISVWNAVKGLFMGNADF